MKKSILILALIVAVISGQAYAQCGPPPSGTSSFSKHKVGLNLGASGIGFLVKVVDNVSMSDDMGNPIDNHFIGESTPVIQGTYDYFPAKWFSIGFATSYQRYSLGYNDPSMTVVLDDSLSNIDFAFNRMNFAVRPMFHYGGENVRFYSGLRIGYLYNRIKVDSDDPDFHEALDLNGYTQGLGDNLTTTGFGRMSMQLVLLGMNIDVADNIGINIEGGVGAPHYFTAGVYYRFD